MVYSVESNIIRVNLTREELKGLKLRAATAETSVPELAAAALRAVYGLGGTRWARNDKQKARLNGKVARGLRNGKRAGVERIKRS